MPKQDLASNSLQVLINRLNGLVGRVFANGLGDWGLIPG